MSPLSFSFFQSVSFGYVLMTVIVAFVVLMIPGLLVTGAKPQGVARAVSCYLWKTVGLVILGMSVLQLASDLVEGRLPDPQLLSGLILLFAVGVGTMVQASRVVKSVDEASSVVARLVFTHACEMIGGIIALVSVLSVALTILLTNELALSNWQLPTTTFVLGIVTMLAAATHIRNKNGGTKVVRKKK